VTVAEREGRRLVVVVLRDTREQVVADTTTLLEWGFSRPLVPATPPPPTATIPPTAFPPAPTPVPSAPTSTPATIAPAQAPPTPMTPTTVPPLVAQLASTPILTPTPAPIDAVITSTPVMAASTAVTTLEGGAAGNAVAPSQAGPWPWWLLLPVLATLAMAGGLRLRRRPPGGGA
jgi:D-alanyl-D-alanine carboxypeptidase